MSEQNATIRERMENENWQNVRLDLHYTFQGRNRRKQFNINRDAVQQEEIAKFQQQRQEVVERFGADSVQAEELPTLDEFLDDFEDNFNFEQAVLEHAQGLVRRVVVQPGRGSNEIVVLPPNAIDFLVITVEDKAQIVLPGE